MILTTQLSSLHNKKAFTCGQPLLDRYIQTQAGQDVKRKLANCFVLSDDQDTILGFYTLSNDSIPRDYIPSSIPYTIPYPSVPVTLLGRLAVDSRYKGQGLGKLLLFDALKRSYDVSVTSLGSVAVIVDAIDEAAATFYEQYGFTRLANGRMFLPMHQIAKAFETRS